MEITILGTSAMIPTKERNHVSFFISHKGKGILVDCGEGTQRQLKIAGIRPSQINIILVSHWHGDHTIGLPGLIQTMAGTGYEGKILLFGPKDTKKHYKYMHKAFPFDDSIDVDVVEVSKEKIYEDEELIIKSYPLEHPINCIGFRIEEKDRRKINIPVAKKLNIPEGPLLGKLQDGKSIVFEGKKISAEEATFVIKGKIIGYISDTGMCNNMLKIAKDTDVLVCESTYMSADEEKAKEYLHLTSSQAAQIASQANAKKLILLHFSQRYKDIKEMEDEAKTIFPETVCAYDFMKIRI